MLIQFNLTHQGNTFHYDQKLKMSFNAGYQKHLLKKIGQRCIQVTYGTNRENTIVLAI